MFLTKNAGSDSVARFALSQGSYISRKTAGLAKCCHLPSSQSALLPQHSSFTILLPSSFSSVSVIFEVLYCFVTTEHPSAPPACSSTLPHFTYSAFTSCFSSQQLRPPAVLFCLTRSAPSLFVPLTGCLIFPLEGERRAGAQGWRSPACSSSSLCSALKVGGGGSRADPSARGPRLSSAGPLVPWEAESCCCSCRCPRKLVKKLVRRMRVPSTAVLCSSWSSSSLPSIPAFSRGTAVGEERDDFTQTGKWHHDFEEILKCSKSTWCLVWFLFS